MEYEILEAAFEQAGQQPRFTHFLVHGDLCSKNREIYRALTALEGELENRPAPYPHTVLQLPRSRVARATRGVPQAWCCWPRPSA